jgi:hypothetical protein
METKVLLRLIRDDIKLLDEINGSFIGSVVLTEDEVEVALSRARNLVREFEMLSKNITQFNGSSFPPEVKVKSRQEQKEEKIYKEETELIDLDEDEASTPIVNVENIKIAEMPVAEKVAQKEKTLKVQKSEEPEELPAKAEAVEVPKEVSNDKPQSVNDLLAQDRIEGVLEGIPLKNIRDGIGLNDKFLFIRELFADDQDKYENTLVTLNAYATIEEAVAFLKQNFKWNKSEASQKFLALVKRRFSKQTNG